MTPYPDGPEGPPSPKVLRLCAQVHDALSFALGETTDPVLLDLTLDRVEPLAGDRQLLVVLHDPHGHGIVAALAALDRAHGFLATAVARWIHRRRAPLLSFTIEPGGSTGERGFAGGSP